MDDLKFNKYASQSPLPYRNNWIDKLLYLVSIPACWVINKLMNLGYK